MTVLLNEYIFALRKKSIPFHPEGTVKCTQLAPKQIHREANKNGALDKVKI